MSWAGKNNGKITNQFTAGGDKKAGIPSSVGRGQFAYVDMFGKAGRVAGTIPTNATYAIACVNQVGGIGRNKGVFSNTRGVGGPNTLVCAMGRARVRAGGPLWF